MRVDTRLYRHVSDDINRVISGLNDSYEAFQVIVDMAGEDMTAEISDQFLQVEYLIGEAMSILATTGDDIDELVDSVS